MGKETHIQWTDATWNPWHGCHKVSDGCKNCYMFREFVKQLGANVWDGNVQLKLRDRKGGDMAEWPEDLRVREDAVAGKNIKLEVK